jgi:hypothetical protein
VESLENVSVRYKCDGGILSIIRAVFSSFCHPLSLPSFVQLSLDVAQSTFPKLTIALIQPTFLMNRPQSLVALNATATVFPCFPSLEKTVPSVRFCEKA